MKKVFSSHADVVHAFAQRTYPEGRAGNIFFYGDKIYSYGYHYLMGKFIDDKTIVIDDRGYSSSTAKHLGILRSATRQYRQLFTSDIDLGQVRKRILEANEKLQKARKPELYIPIIIQGFETLTAHLKEFKKVSLIKSDHYKEIKKIYTALKKDEGKYLDAARAIAKKKQEQEKKKLQADLKKFFNYETDYLYTRNIKEDYIRISQDGERIETTQGVKIDINDARNLYRLIKAGVDVKGERIGSYRVTSLNGHLVVGCHRINTKNMHEVGAKILK